MERLNAPITKLIGNPFLNLIIKGAGGIGKSMMRHLFLYFNLILMILMKFLTAASV